MVVRAKHSTILPVPNFAGNLGEHFGKIHVQVRRRVDGVLEALRRGRQWLLRLGVDFRNQLLQVCLMPSVIKVWPSSTPDLWLERIAKAEEGPSILRIGCAGCDGRVDAPGQPKFAVGIESDEIPGRDQYICNHNRP